MDRKIYYIGLDFGSKEGDLTNMIDINNLTHNELLSIDNNIDKKRLVVLNEDKYLELLDKIDEMYDTEKMLVRKIESMTTIDKIRKEEIESKNNEMKKLRAKINSYEELIEVASAILKDIDEMVISVLNSTYEINKSTNGSQFINKMRSSIDDIPLASSIRVTPRATSKWTELENIIKTEFEVGGVYNGKNEQRDGTSKS